MSPDCHKSPESVLTVRQTPVHLSQQLHVLSSQGCDSWWVWPAVPSSGCVQPPPPPPVGVASCPPSRCGQLLPSPVTCTELCASLAKYNQPVGGSRSLLSEHPQLLGTHSRHWSTWDTLDRFEASLVTLNNSRHLLYTMRNLETNWSSLGHLRTPLDNSQGTLEYPVTDLDTTLAFKLPGDRRVPTLDAFRPSFSRS
jgi:hypothetical protein